MGLAAVLVWAALRPSVPLALPEDVTPSVFSAARAGEMLERLLGEQPPRPAGSPANDAFRQRLLVQLSRLGVAARVEGGMSCAARRGAVMCAQVRNVVAEVLPGSGKAVVLMAHLDSVAAGPGAGDDASGVAILLETIRALKTGGATGHPVIALFSDGEEMGLLGAAKFLEDPLNRARIGVVINAEARGNRGPSYLFQTSAGDSALIGLYAQGAQRPAASSLYAEIYKYLPNDTDLTPFLREGIAGYNFAFIGNSAHYHTARDTLANLSRGSLQSQGDNVLSLARGLVTADFASLQGQDSIYFDVLGFVPRLAASFALPLALLALAGIALAGWLNLRPRRGRQGMMDFVLPPLLLAGAVGMGFALHGLAAVISGNPDPSFATPEYLRAAFMFGVFAVLLGCARGSGSIAAWGWLAGFGVAAAIFAPGLSPYFIFPAALAALLLLVSVRGGRTPALIAAAAGAMIVWLGFAAESEAIMGLSAHFLFTLPAALGLMALLPLLPPLEKNVRAISAAAAFAAALGCCIYAGLQPAYSEDQPLRLNLRYAEKDGKSWLLADPVAKLPEGLRAAAKFSAAPQTLQSLRGYAAPMGQTRLPAPSISITRLENRLTLNLHGGRGASAMTLLLPEGLSAVSLGGTKLPAQSGLLRCGTPDCASAQIILEFTGVLPKSLLLVEERRGLPVPVSDIAAARPAWAVPSGQGDMTYLATDMPVPGWN